LLDQTTPTPLVKTALQGLVLQQWSGMRGVVNLFIRQVKSDDFITISVDADMKLAPGLAIRSSVFFEQPPATHKPGG
jgi:hypothetical protein